MTFQFYQSAAMRTCLPQCATPDYMILGLLNETGELGGKIKKALRGDFPLASLPALAGPEIGDCLWYAVGTLHVYKRTMTDVAHDLDQISLAEFQQDTREIEDDLPAAVVGLVAPPEPSFINLPAVLRTIKLMGATAGEIGESETLNDNTAFLQDDLLDRVNDYLTLCAELCEALGLSLQAVAEDNLAKLQSRQSRALLQGNGDHR